MSSPVSPPLPPSDRSDLTLEVRRDDVTLGFEEVGDKEGVEGDIPEISDTDENLMKILEKALEDAGIGKDKIKSVKGSFEKEEGNIVAETYTRVGDQRTAWDRRGEEHTGDPQCWKFKMKWTINVDGGPPIEKTVWIKTPQKIPLEMSSVKEYEHSKHLALLYVKTLRHIHKAALDPNHADYAKVKKKIEFLRDHNQLKMAFKTSHWTEGTEALDRFFWGRFRIRKGEYAQWTEVTLDEDKPAKTFMEKINKLVKGKFSIDYLDKDVEGKYGEAGVGYKYKEQASELVVKDERLQAFEALSKASKADDFIGKFKGYAGKYNNSSELFGRISALSYAMKATREARERRDKLKKADKALQKPILQKMIEPIDLKTAIDKYEEALKAGEDTKALKENLRKEYDEIKFLKSAFDDIKEIKEFMALKKEQIDELVEHYKDLEGDLELLSKGLEMGLKGVDKIASQDKYQNLESEVKATADVLKKAKSLLNAADSKS